MSSIDINAIIQVHPEFSNLLTRLISELEGRLHHDVVMTLLELQRADNHLVLPWADLCSMMLRTAASCDCDALALIITRTIIFCPSEHAREVLETYRKLAAFQNNSAAAALAAADSYMSLMSSAAPATSVVATLTRLRRAGHAGYAGAAISLAFVAALTSTVDYSAPAAATLATLATAVWGTWSLLAAAGHTTAERQMIGDAALFAGLVSTSRHATAELLVREPASLRLADAKEAGMPLHELVQAVAAGHVTEAATLLGLTTIGAEVGHTTLQECPPLVSLAARVAVLGKARATALLGVLVTLPPTNRVATFGQLAAALGLDEADVDTVVYGALEDGLIKGRVDAYARHVVVDAVRPLDAMAADQVRDLAARLRAMAKAAATCAVDLDKQAAMPEQTFGNL